MEDDRGRRAGSLFLPPYSPSFNPDEKAFFKLNALFRVTGERTAEGLWTPIGLLEAYTPTTLSSTDADARHPAAPRLQAPASLAITTLTDHG